MARRRVGRYCSDSIPPAEPSVSVRPSAVHAIHEIELYAEARASNATRATLLHTLAHSDRRGRRRRESSPRIVVANLLYTTQ